MKYKWAVAIINFFDNELNQKVVETEDDNWKTALCSAFGDYSSLSSDIKEAKEEAFNADFMFECTLISKKKGSKCKGDKKVKLQCSFCGDEIESIPGPPPIPPHACKKEECINKRRNKRKRIWG